LKALKTQLIWQQLGQIHSSQFTPSYGMVLNLLQTTRWSKPRSWWNAAFPVCGEAEVEAAVQKRSRNFKHN